MTQIHESAKTRMVIQPHPLLKVWWARMDDWDKREVQKHIGHLPSLMEMEAWPDLVNVMIKFWDSECMVFRFGNVELTPTLEEVLASYESVGMYNKRKAQPDSDILIPKIWNPKEAEEALSSINVKWMNQLKEPHITLRELYYRFGRTDGYTKYKGEFTSKQMWEDKKSFFFAVCLLGTIVFPQNRGHVIHPSIIMVTHTIFYGIRRGTSIKHYTLAPMILADIYRALDKCWDGSGFFQGCNLVLQWWMMKHLLKAHSPIEPDSKCRSDQFASHDWWLHFNHLKPRKGQQFWMSILSGLREEDVQWSMDGVVLSNTVVRSKKFPFLVLPGLKGTRSYIPARVLRQLGCRQDIPQTGDMRKFATDHEDGHVSFVETILREWRIRSVAGGRVPNRFNPECSEKYKNWLKDNITKTIRPSPGAPNSAKGVEAENQLLQRQHLRDAKVIEQLRQCIMELDGHMEHQIQTLEEMGHEGAQSARDYLQENRYFIWHEVEIAKGTRVITGAEEV